MKIKTALSVISALTLLFISAGCGSDKSGNTGSFKEKVTDAPFFTAKSTTIATTAVTTVTTTTTQAPTEKPTEKPTEAPTEPPTEKPTESKMKFYESGMYKVGTDIQEGEYFVFSLYSNGYVCVSSDANQNDIIYNEIFDNNLIITIYDGEYVKLSDCTAISNFEEDVKTDSGLKTYEVLMEDALDKGAMYQVGTMLDAGEYKLECTGSSGYYCIYSDSRHDDIIANDIFDTSTYVDVSDGEYILLKDCKIVE